MKIAVYTRAIDKDTYTSYLGNSIHFAISKEGTGYQALNQNYGILFAEATINSDNTIQAKGVKNPYIFKTKDGSFVIIATRVNADGSEDEECRDKVLLWTSADLISFSKEQIVELHKDERLQSVYPQNGITLAAELPNAWGAKLGNVIDVDKELIEELLLKWSPLENISIHVPDSIKAVGKQDIEDVMAQAFYMDGSSTLKKVIWSTENVDFGIPGTYEVKGTVIQDSYKFPLAVGYADPDIIKWEDNYYFIATNDNTDDKGLYVRKADTVGALFSTDIKEYLILDVDVNKNFIQTFWAPEFHVIGNDLYILFAVSGEEWGPQSHVMKLKKGGSIIRPEDWENPIRVMKKDGTFLAKNQGITLDMTYFSLERKAYLVWSYREHIGTPLDTGSMLFIATIDPKEPWILTSEPVLLSRPLFGWENNDNTINNEGPYALITDKKVFLTYSGGAAGGYTYTIGLLSAERGDDLLNPVNWIKSGAPVQSFASIPGEYGPGHNTFFKDDVGNVMIAYHAQEQLQNSPRCTGVHRVHFDKNGIPRFDMSENRDLYNDLKNVLMKVIVE